MNRAWIWLVPVAAPMTTFAEPRPAPTGPPPVTVRVAELAYKRLPPRGNPPKVDLPVAQIIWETLPVRDPLQIVDRSDPQFGMAIASALQTTAEGQPLQQNELVASTDLSSVDCRDIGWTMSFVEGSHLIGHDLYRQAIARVHSSTLCDKSSSEELYSLLKGLRVKLYYLNDWESVAKICGLLEPVDKGTNDQFWTQMYMMQSRLYRSDTRDLEPVIQLLRKIHGRFAPNDLGDRESRELHWMSGLIYFQAEEFSKAIPYLRIVAEMQQYSHRREARRMLVVALFHEGMTKQALTAVDLYKTDYVVSFSEAVEFERLLWKDQGKNNRRSHHD